MNCKRCGDLIEPGDEREHLGSLVCEDCYMDLLSPVKACDPWAVYTAKSCTSLENNETAMSDVQQNIIAVLNETGGLEPHSLMERLNMKASDLDRELAALRHMEKIKAELRNGKKIITLW